MTPRQHFKFAFFQHCLDAGLDFDQMLELAKSAETQVKQASDPISWAAGEIYGGAKHLLGKGLEYSVPLLLLAPPLLGGAVGYVAASANSPTMVDPDDVKDKMLLKEYKTQTERLKNIKAIRMFEEEENKNKRDRAMLL